MAFRFIVLMTFYVSNLKLLVIRGRPRGGLFLVVPADSILGRHRLQITLEREYEVVENQYLKCVTDSNSHRTPHPFSADTSLCEDSSVFPLG